jgi:D-aminopeptidase
MRSRDLGIHIGRGWPGPENAITDVAGVRVGHTTLIAGDGPLVVGVGPVRTGVTVVVPHDGDPWAEPVFAGAHRLNGNGELTGLEWIREAGQLGGIVALTNTHSVGIVHDALIGDANRAAPSGAPSWSLPVVGETWDGSLNDTSGFHVRAEHVDAAIAAAVPGPVAEGGVGGGTGMVCHEFKGGIGTSSRVVAPDEGGWTVGALVQANYGQRSWLRVDGVRVGEAIPTADVPSPYEQADALDAERTPMPPPGSGSIIVLLATDAPLLPHQCARLAQRAGLGLARVGGTGGNYSGDLFLAWATGNRDLPGFPGTDARRTVDLRMVADRAIDPLFEAAIEATEEAIVNALVGATTMTGRDGITAHALPHDRLVEAMARAGRIRPATMDRGQASRGVRRPRRAPASRSARR